MATAALEHLPADSWTAARSETLFENPRIELRRLIEFCGLGATDAQIESMGQSFRKHIASLPVAKADDARLEPILPILRPQLQRLGYVVAQLFLIASMNT